MHRFPRAQLVSLGLIVAVGAAFATACTKLTEPATKETYDRPAPPPPPPAASSAPGAADGAPSDAGAADAARVAEADAGSLEKKDVKLGKGAEAKEGDTVQVYYRGTLLDGTEFDSSKKHAPPDGGKPEPFTFTLGRGQVIKGWDQGVPGMKVGGKRELTIPPTLAYGARALPSIPANSTLKFEVELLGIVGKDGGK